MVAERAGWLFQRSRLEIEREIAMLGNQGEPQLGLVNASGT